MKIYILAIFLILSSHLFSATYEDIDDLWYGKKRFTPAKSLAMSGAENVGANRSEAAFLNPATLITKEKKYIIGFDAQYSSDSIPTQMMVSAVDSRTSILAGGAYASYYTYSKKVNGKTVNYSNLQVGLSYAYPIMGGLVLGIGGRYLKYTKNDDNYIHTVTFDLGATYSFSPYVKIGVVGYNLTNIDNIEAPMRMAGGISVGDEKLFLFNFDVVADFSAPEIYHSSDSALYEYHACFEFMPTEGFSILGGYEINKILDKNYWSAGFQLFVPESRVELVTGYQQAVKGKKDKYFNFSLRLYF